MPSNSQRLIAAIASIAFTIGGAWAASQINSSPDQAQTNSSDTGLSITFDSLRNANGSLVVMVFDDQSAFEELDVNGLVGYQELQAKNGLVTAAFPDLRAGPYAVAAFHDENSNGDLDMNGVIPLEGYATTGAADAYDTPPFAKAAVAPGDVTVKIHYLD